MYYGDPDAENGSGDSDEDASGKVKIVVARGSRAKGKPNGAVSSGNGSRGGGVPAQGLQDHSVYSKGPQTTIFEVDFTPPRFQPRYQRNNKRGGLKNLRCFPLCSAEHKERGFCGRPVMVSLRECHAAADNLRKSQIARPAGEAKHSHAIVCWAQFLPVSESLKLREGTTVPLSTALALERTRQHPLRPWMRGKRLGSADVVNQLTIDTRQIDPGQLEADDYFGFNMETKGWHYGWASNKHSCNAEHSVHVFVFRKVERDEPREALDPNFVDALQHQLTSISSPSLSATKRSRVNVPKLESIELPPPVPSSQTPGMASSLSVSPTQDHEGRSTAGAVKQENVPAAASSSSAAAAGGDQDRNGHSRNGGNGAGPGPSLTPIAAIGRAGGVTNNGKIVDLLEDLGLGPDIDPDQVFLECVAVAKSPRFQLFCRRRRRYALDPTAPPAPAGPRAAGEGASRKTAALPARANDVGAAAPEPPAKRTKARERRSSSFKTASGGGLSEAHALPGESGNSFANLRAQVGLFARTDLDELRRRLGSQIEQQIEELQALHHFVLQQSTEQSAAKPDAAEALENLAREETAGPLWDQLRKLSEDQLRLVLAQSILAQRTSQVSPVSTDALGSSSTSFHETKRKRDTSGVLGLRTSPSLTSASLATSSGSSSSFALPRPPSGLLNLAAAIGDAQVNAGSLRGGGPLPAAVPGDGGPSHHGSGGGGGDDDEEWEEDILQDEEDDDDDDEGLEGGEDGEGVDADAARARGAAGVAADRAKGNGTVLPLPPVSKPAHLDQLQQHQRQDSKARDTEDDAIGLLLRISGQSEKQG